MRSFGNLTEITVLWEGQEVNPDFRCFLFNLSKNGQVKFLLNVLAIICKIA